MAQRRTPARLISRPVSQGDCQSATGYQAYRATGTTLHFRPLRNGGPLPGLYQHRDDVRLAAQAWNRVAAIQARLRGEPEPAPVARPWTLPPCEGCGYRFRCDCPGGPR